MSTINFNFTPEQKYKEVRIDDRNASIEYTTNYLWAEDNDTILYRGKTYEVTFWVRPEHKFSPWESYNTTQRFHPSEIERILESFFNGTYVPFGKKRHVYQPA